MLVTRGTLATYATYVCFYPYLLLYSKSNPIIMRHIQIEITVMPLGSKMPYCSVPECFKKRKRKIEERSDSEGSEDESSEMKRKYPRSFFRCVCHVTYISRLRDILTAPFCGSMIRFVSNKV